MLGTSVSVGVIERSGMMDAVPETFGGIWVAVSILLVLLVFVGMIIMPLVRLF